MEEGSSFLNSSSSGHRGPRFKTLPAMLVVLVTLTACGGGGDSSQPPPPPSVTYSVGGSVSGLTAAGLVLANGSDTLNVSANATSFTMPAQVTTGTAYAVTVKTQPSGLNCKISGGTGTIAAAAMNSIAVVCHPLTYAVGGSVAGLNAAGLVLTNGSDTLNVSANATAFTMPTQLTTGTAYALTVKTQPSGLNCQVSNGTGTIAAAAITNIAIACRPATYSIGGSVSGLSAAGLVLANGSDTLGVPANASSFTMPTPLVTGTAYAVTVKTQPPALSCVVSSGTGTVGMAAVTVVKVQCATNGWVWQGGSSTINQKGVYGALGVGAAGNIPGARESSAFTTDLSGNFWLFGGYGADSSGVMADLNDLWMYNPTTGYWTWVSGSISGNATAVYGTKGQASAANHPGALEVSVLWADTSGNLWVFGAGPGVTPALNTLWKYNRGTGYWTWVTGSNTPSQAGVYGTKGVAAASNVPGARYGSASWTDASGNFWLFGGTSGDTSAFNDLWKFDPTTGLWTWVSGSSSEGQAGVYGTQTVPSASNVPGSRIPNASWTDTAGNLWLSGGFGIDSAGSEGNLNDLWEFTPGTGTWTWVSGSKTSGAQGMYGTQGQAAAANVPGPRGQSTSWIDALGNLWLFGGTGVDASGTQGQLNDLWMFSPTTGLWTWVQGSSSVYQTGSYGTQGQAAVGNTPGARTGGAGWTDRNGYFWLFGGIRSTTATAASGSFNDLWEYFP
jgi:N-acetylneuraminic acid mutarotase